MLRLRRPLYGADTPLAASGSGSPPKGGQATPPEMGLMGSPEDASPRDRRESKMRSLGSWVESKRREWIRSVLS